MSGNKNASNHRLKHGRKYSRTKKGWASKSYGGMVQRSKRRGHPLPNFTLEDFKSWCFSQKEFHELFNVWVNLNFDTDYRPSVDRLSNKLSYVFSNMQVITSKENQLKDAANNLPKKAVIQLSLEGKPIMVFNSVTEANEATGVEMTGIIKCCNGKRKSGIAGNYRWNYKVVI